MELDLRTIAVLSTVLSSLVFIALAAVMRDYPRSTFDARLVLGVATYFELRGCNLLREGAESLILEQSEIGRISTMVKDCLRCGKCKPVCSTHVPRANLLYSPRNKILATGLPARSD
jgi:ferredoxin